MRFNSIKIIYSEFNIYKECFESDLWFLIFIKCEIKNCDSTSIMHIFGKEVAKSWPEFYADYDGTNSFWKFWDLDQNNPSPIFASFSANISVYE